MQGVTISSDLYSSDNRKAFFQLTLLDVVGKEITTFETHRGIFRFKRLPIGANVSMELIHTKLMVIKDRKTRFPLVFRDKDYSH